MFQGCGDVLEYGTELGIAESDIIKLQGLEIRILMEKLGQSEFRTEGFVVVIVIVPGDESHRAEVAEGLQKDVQTEMWIVKGTAGEDVEFNLLQRRRTGECVTELMHIGGGSHSNAGIHLQRTQFGSQSSKDGAGKRLGP